MASAQLVPGKIRLEVVTPEGSVLSELVDELTSPSQRGTFGVLPGHVPLMAALRIGLISYRQGGTSISCAVGPGFVEVADDHAILLTDRFCRKDDVDVVDTRMRLKDVSAKLTAWNEEPGTPEHDQLVAEEQWLAALLELYGDPPAPIMRPWRPYRPMSEVGVEPTPVVAEEPPAQDVN